ncbi:MAG TPA: hypothetical protein VL921_11825 [Candidatus Udaeobacter sp.]|nr:hypothetical protein [Candidatus Udaeobacter sp.]
MDDSTFKSSCQIERIGEIVKLDEQAAVILINGKTIIVPIAKVAGEVCYGDRVFWTGNCWRRKLES